MKKIKKYLNKKEYIIFALSLVIILLSTFSFAFYYNVENTEENIVTSECFKLEFEDQDDINLGDVYPISDSEGSNLKPYTFTIRNVCNKAGEYQVNIETLNSSTLSTNYLKYKLNNQTPSILGNQLEVQEYINSNVRESRNLDNNILLPNEEVTYNLRLWIDEESTYEQTSDKTYISKVVVKTANNNPYKTITLNTNGGEVETPTIDRVRYRSIGDIPTPTRLGYDFLGWYSDSLLTQEIDSNTEVTNDTDSIYAKWQRRVEYAEVDKLKTAASGKGNGVYYYDSNGNLDYGNGTKINLSNPNSQIKGNVSIWNNTPIYACIYYNNHNYEYYGKRDEIIEKSIPCSITRYTNLVYNGDMALKNNTNFTFATYNSSGYFYTTSKTMSLSSSDYIAIDPNKKYQISMDVKSSASASYLIGIFEYDADFSSIADRSLLHYSNTLTTLTRDLKEGDTTIYASSLANWNVTSNDSTANYRQRIMFWDYKDYTGYTYPAQTYSYHYTTDDSYVDSNVNKTNNTIKLKKAYTGETVKVGTKISQGDGGSTYNYALAYGTISTSWTTLSKTMTGYSSGGSSGTSFRYGTKFIKFYMNPDYGKSLSSLTTYFKNITIKEIK